MPEGLRGMFDRLVLGKKGPESEGPKEERERSRHRLTRLERLAQAAAVGGALAASPEAPVASASDRQTELLHTETREEEGAGMDFDLDGYWPMIDASGKFHWENPSLPYAAVSMEGSDKEVKNVEVVIPAQWARYFDTADWSDPETRAKLGAYVSEKVRGAFLEDLYGIASHEQDYATKKGLAGVGWEVKRATVIGTASPEGAEPESILPGHVDERNIDLAKVVRGEEAATLVVESLRSLGVNVDASLLNVKGEEIQFSDADMEELRQLAQDLGKKGSETDMIWQLIKDYNRDRIEDPIALQELDRMVADKRMVRVVLEMEHNEKDTVLIPWALLGLALLRRRRHDGEPVPPFEKPIGPKREPILDTIPSGENLEDTRVIVQNVECDIEANLSFYEPLMEAFAYDPEKEDEPDVNEMTHAILDRWTDNDNTKRAEAGLAPEQNHHTRPRQVFWANLHARALARIMIEAENRDQTYWEVWKTEAARKAAMADVAVEVRRLAALQATREGKELDSQ